MSELLLMVIISFVFGIIHGSFFNVVALRIPNGESIVYPDSHCTSCKRYLKWYELIPVFSYLFLGGKCRTCKSKVSILYPTTEFITGCLFVAIIVSFGLNFQTLLYLLIASMLVIITITDIRLEIIPNKILLFFSIVLIPISFFADTVTITEQLLGFGVSVAINFLILFFSKGNGMGGGDVKLFLLLGFVLGLKVFLILFMLSVVIGLVVGTYVKLTTKSRVIPFGPSIALGTLITLFYGNQLATWYLTLFL